MPTAQVQSEVTIAALRLACRAPSLHISQPWCWIATNRFVQLFADPTRLVRSADTTGREALLCCGAVLDHFRVAMSTAGWHTRVHRFPDPDNPTHLATIEFSTAAVSVEHTRRAEAILLRRPDQLPLSAPPGWPALSSSDLSWWTVDFATNEGIPPNSLISAAESERVDIGRTSPPIAQLERRAKLDYAHSKILALSTVEDSTENVLRCGEVLSSALLDAASAGMSTCTLTHITEVPTGRDIISSLLPGDAVPEALVRVGLAPAMDAAPPPTPRRPIAHVLQMLRERTC